MQPRAADDRVGTGAMLYCAWAAIAIGTSLVIAGAKAESLTRLLVLALIAAQFVLRAPLLKALPQLTPRWRFVALGMLLAALVEGFHMISKPVYDTLLVTPGLAPAEALRRYAIDLMATLPAYLLIFSVIWFFVVRYRYALWTYIITMGVAQALGDGGIFYFIGAPQMLFFLPYPMSNYHAINVLPFLAVRDALVEARDAGWRSLLAIPAVIATYLICGAVIKAAGRAAGLETG
jgi:hypothetical protein